MLRKILGKGRKMRADSTSTDVETKMESDLDAGSSKKIINVEKKNRGWNGSDVPQELPRKKQKRKRRQTGS